MVLDNNLLVELPTTLTNLSSLTSLSVRERKRGRAGGRQEGRRGQGRRVLECVSLIRERERERETERERVSERLCVREKGERGEGGGARASESASNGERRVQWRA